MDRRVIWTSSHGILLLIGLAGLAFTSGYWGILLALAPTAYLLVMFPYESDNSPQTVVICHLIALIVGGVTYTFLARGILLTDLEPMSEPGLRIVGSALLAFVGCTIAFYVLRTQHAMAYVTAFTAAIGVFSTIQATAIMVIAILLVAGLQILRQKLGPRGGVTSDEPVGSFS